MADENVTASENTTETNEQAATPATQASKPAVPSPAAMKPHAPSPAAFAKKAPQRPATSTGFSEADIKATEAFGRVADDGTVFVKEGEGEREVGPVSGRFQGRGPGTVCPSLSRSEGKARPVRQQAQVQQCEEP